VLRRFTDNRGECRRSTENQREDRFVTLNDPLPTRETGPVMIGFSKNEPMKTTDSNILNNIGNNDRKETEDRSAGPGILRNLSSTSRDGEN
jgi:hypothetical protein